MNHFFHSLIRLFFAGDDGGGGGNANEEGEATGGAAADTTSEEENPRKGWWASQVPDAVWEANKDAILALKDKTFGDVVGDYLNVRKTMERAVLIPGENATPEEIKSYLTKMGVPETPDGYGFKAEHLGDLDKDGTFTKSRAERFLKAGLSKTQAAKVFADDVATAKAAIAMQETQQKEAAKTFEARLLDFHKNDEKKATEISEYFKRFLVEVGDKEIVASMKASGLLYNPRFASAIAAYHKSNATEPPFGGGRRAPRGPEGEKKGKGFKHSEEFHNEYGDRG